MPSIGHSIAIGPNDEPTPSILNHSEEQRDPTAAVPVNDDPNSSLRPADIDEAGARIKRARERSDSEHTLNAPSSQESKKKRKKKKARLNENT